MRLRGCFSAAVVLLLLVSVCSAEEPPIKTKERLQTAIDELWREASERGLIKEEALKPIVVVSAKKRGNLFAVTVADVIFFYPMFFNFDYKSKLSVSNYKVQKFILGHEIGHSVLGHGLHGPDVGESVRTLLVRDECEVYVFTARAGGSDSLSVLRVWEKKNHRQTKTEKVFSFFAAPISLAVDAAVSLKHGENRFWNPLGRHRRGASIHGPASYRAILVLEGKRQSCGE